ncbi:RING finger protein 34 [Chamberlinius hualienensis]
MPPKKSVSREIKPVTNKSNINDCKVNFILTTYNDSPSANKTKLNTSHSTQGNDEVEHVKSITTFENIVDAAKHIDIADNLKVKSNNMTANKSSVQTNSNANNCKSTTTPAVKWVTANAKLSALPNVTIGPYDHQLNKHLHLNIMNDKQLATSNETNSTETAKFTNVLLEINNQKPTKNAIISPGITIRDVETLDDISSLNLIQKLSIRQLKAIAEKEQIDPCNCLEIDELRDAVAKHWIKKELIKEGHNDFCMTCLNNKNDCLLLLCGHQKTCMKCAENITDCPVCKSFIVRKVHVYVT